MYGLIGNWEKETRCATAKFLLLHCFPVSFSAFGSHQEERPFFCVGEGQFVEGRKSWKLAKGMKPFAYAWKAEQSRHGESEHEKFSQPPPFQPPVRPLGDYQLVSIVWYRSLEYGGKTRSFVTVDECRRRRRRRGGREEKHVFPEKVRNRGRKVAVTLAKGLRRKNQRVTVDETNVK